MVRKMAYVGFSYLLGLLFASFFYFKLNIAIGIILIVAATAFGVMTKGKKPVVCVCFVCFSVGAVFYSCYDELLYEKIIAYADNTVEVNGVLTSYKYSGSDMAFYTINGTINGTTSAEITCYGIDEGGRVGDEIYVKGKAAVPNNTYLFNSKDYYKAKGIYLSISWAEDIEVTPANKLPLKRALCSYREYIYDKMNNYLGSEEMAITKAMLFGDKSDIEDTTVTLLYRAGIGHIMAVSGVHLSTVCSLFWFILCLFPMNKYVRFGILLVPMGLFVMLSGASNSVIRAAIMLILVYGSNLFNRRADIMNSLGIAAIILTAACPFTVRDASFLLSVAGVIGIGAVAPAVIELIEQKYTLKKYMKSFIASFCVSVIVFPVSFLFFDEISVISPFSNMLLIPLCTVILTCGVISALFGGATLVMIPMMKVCGICCKFVLIVSKLLGSFQFAYIPLGYKFTGFAIISSIVIVVAAAFYFRKAAHIAAISVGVFFLCTAVIAFYRVIPSDHISLAVLNNGKGSVAIVVQDRRKASVIDLIKGGRTAGCIVKYLNRHGINRIELLGLTVDDITSVSIYQHELELFDISSIISPENDYEISFGYLGADNVVKYDINRDSVITASDFRLLLSENNTVLFNINGYIVLAYNGKTTSDLSGNYDVVIDYAGTSANENITGDIVIFVNDDAKASVSKDSSVYIGENVEINIYKDKIESEVIYGGNSY